MTWLLFHGRGYRAPTISVTSCYVLALSTATTKSSTLAAGDRVVMLYDSEARAVAFMTDERREGWLVRSNGTGLVVSCGSFLRNVLGHRAIGRYPRRIFEHEGQQVEGFSLHDRQPLRPAKTTKRRRSASPPLASLVSKPSTAVVRDQAGSG